MQDLSNRSDADLASQATGLINFLSGRGSDEPAEDRFRQLADVVPLGLLFYRGGGITYANPAAVQMLGVSDAAALTNRPLLDFVDPAFREISERRGRDVMAGRSPGGMIRLRVVRDDGSKVDLEVMTVVFRDVNGTGGFSLAADVTERIAAEQALVASEQRWRSLVQHASDMVAVLNADGTVQYATPAAERLLGYAQTDGVGTNMVDFVHPEDMVAVADAFLWVLDNPGAPRRVQFRVARQDGTWCWVESIAINWLDDPIVGGVVCNVRDVSHRQTAEDALRHQASHDSLTGLPNRMALCEELDRATTARSGLGALLLLDMDGFKDVNDGLGHAVGDRQLQEMATRLQRSVRAGDLVARLGGDEFAVALRNLVDIQDATRVADQILDALRKPVEIDGTLLYLAASIGIAHWPDHGEDAAGLLQAADIAMYRAKEEGMAWAVYNADDHRSRKHRLTLLSELRQVLDNKTIEVHFQPQIELATGAVRRVEALLRCSLPSLGRISPGEFIPLVERTGLIRPLTTQVLDIALAQCARWRAEGLSVPVAVNLSASSLRDLTLPDTVSAALRTHDVPPGCLTLELTETAFADGTAIAVRVLAELRRRGIRLSIDDLGSGYSSMAYLKRLPVNEVKIDKSLIMDFSSARDRAIVRSLVELGHAFGLVVVAEGVETSSTAAELLEMGCDIAQGFLYARPAPAAELTGWLRARLADVAETLGKRPVLIGTAGELAAARSSRGN